MELEELIKENTKAIHRNTNETAALKVETKAYRGTTEEALKFQKKLISDLISHEQNMQKRWLDAVIKWGGWAIGLVIGLFELATRLI